MPQLPLSTIQGAITQGAPERGFAMRPGRAGVTGGAPSTSKAGFSVVNAASGAPTRGAGVSARAFVQALATRLQEQIDPAAAAASLVQSGAAASAQAEALPAAGKPLPQPDPVDAEQLAAQTAATGLPPALLVTSQLPAPADPAGARAGEAVTAFLAQHDAATQESGDRPTGRELVSLLSRHAPTQRAEHAPAILRALAMNGALSGTTETLALPGDGASAVATTIPERGATPVDAARTIDAPAPAAQGAVSAHASSILTAANDASSARVPVLDIEHPVGQAAWKEAVGQHVAWMVDSQVSRAELRLHPAHLGPIDVSVTVHNDEVNVSFNATHPATREALESSLPRLRELLGDAGLSLGNASVSQQFAGGQRTPERPEPQPHAGALRFDEQPARAESVTASTLRVGLLDAYA